MIEPTKPHQFTANGPAQQLGQLLILQNHFLKPEKSRGFSFRLGVTAREPSAESEPTPIHWMRRDDAESSARGGVAGKNFSEMEGFAAS